MLIKMVGCFTEEEKKYIELSSYFANNLLVLSFMLNKRRNNFSELSVLQVPIQHRTSAYFMFSRA